MKNKNSKKKPFFASFLEKQLQDPEKIKGGGDVTIATQDGVITTKEADTVTKPIYDMAHTMKYPSDGDDDVPTV
ncbi:microviridin/marinostatin family tricyclic proteinase inhibitor [Chryseobacterium cheonjiense]|uniref:Microviridin/marinostatin family tricyclic proteinase inhibitor n=1 Tax=Chryseobacterium cheonjiense TaxID=2728845 RepID=A0A7Y0FHG6_9FLAO|nr:microviridin/marinostatin family tricyclic proteinase inhibitor [Chryseobacterium cheonjiense]NML56202.1 microviridin/marinostatin family tricyclic proteinase inhibitor [Chryseobacterium cheonjiense]